MTSSWLKKKGVKAILALTETSAPSSWIEDSGIRIQNVPVKNHVAPTLTQLEECVDFIEKKRSSGQQNSWSTVRRVRGELEQ